MPIMKPSADSALGMLPRMRALAWRDLADLLPAQWALVRAQWALARRPAGGLVATEPAAAPEAAVRAESIAEGERWGRAVHRASRFGIFRPKCLARSLATRDLLRARGIGAGRIHIGVRQLGGRLEAHAWVTVGGRLVGDDPRHVARFREIGEQGLAWLT